jgi:heme O synthase-like polyprenyltransferase
MAHLKKLLPAVAGAFMGTILSLTYLLITYNVATANLPYGLDSYSFFIPAIIGLTVTFALATGLFFLLGRKRFAIRIGFAVSTVVCSLIFFAILSSIQYFF